MTMPPPSSPEQKTALDASKADLDDGRIEGAVSGDLVRAWMSTWADDPDAPMPTSKDASVDSYLERVLAGRPERKARLEAEIAAMRAEGIEPAPPGDTYGAGCPTFGFSLRWTDADSTELELRLSVENTSCDHGGSVLLWGQGWPRRGARIDGVALLRALASTWLEIGRFYRCPGVPDPAPESDEIVVDLRLHVGDLSLPPLLIRSGRNELRFETKTAEGPFISALGSESLIAVEVLKTLGNLVCDRLEALGNPGEATTWTREWRGVRDLVDVFPFDLDNLPDGEEAVSDLDAQMEF